MFRHVRGPENAVAGLQRAFLRISGTEAPRSGAKAVGRAVRTHRGRMDSDRYGNEPVERRAAIAGAAASTRGAASPVAAWRAPAWPVPKRGPACTGNHTGRGGSFVVVRRHMLEIAVPSRWEVTKNRRSRHGFRDVRPMSAECRKKPHSHLAAISLSERRRSTPFRHRPDDNAASFHLDGDAVVRPRANERDRGRRPEIRGHRACRRRAPAPIWSDVAIGAFGAM